MKFYIPFLSIFFLFITSCSIDEAKKLTEDEKKEENTFDSKVRGKWIGTLNEKKDGQFIQKGQLLLDLKKNSEFEAILAQSKDFTDPQGSAKGLYSLPSTNRISFNSEDSDIYPQFDIEKIITMEIELKGTELVLKFEDTEIVLTLKERYDAPRNESDAVGSLSDKIYKTCTVSDPQSIQWKFSLSADKNFTTTAISSSGSLNFSGNCIRAENTGKLLSFICKAEKASEESLKESIFVYKVKFKGNKIKKRLLSFESSNLGSFKNYSCL